MADEPQMTIDEMNSVLSGLGGFEKVWSSIGQIVGAFASIEDQLRGYLKEMLGLRPGDPVGTALLGDLSWDKLWTLMLRLMQTRDDPAENIAFVKEMVRRMKAVKHFRDVFSHTSFGLSIVSPEDVRINFLASNPSWGKPVFRYELKYDDLANIVMQANLLSGWLGALHGIVNNPHGIPDLGSDVISQSVRKAPPLPQPQVKS